jgi:sarcosine oxidase
LQSRTSKLDRLLLYRRNVRSFDVAVIGLGAMGSAAAWHLARRGLQVIGLDRYAPPHHFGSSHGHSRIIREAYFEGSAYVPLVRRAYTLWAALEAEAGEHLLEICGGLTIGPADGTLVPGALASARQHGLAHELWTAAEVHARVPALVVPDGLSAVWEPRAGFIRAEPAVHALLAAARGRGAELVFDTTVSGWRREGEAIRLATAAQDYDVRHLVVTAGPWMGEVLPLVKLPLTVERAVQCWFRSSRESVQYGPARLPVFVIEDADHRRLWYGLPDEGYGVKFARHHSGDTTTADTVSRLVDDGERTVLRQEAIAWLPGLGEAIDATVCLYTNTPDLHFVIDRHPDDPSIVFASACSGHGFKFAPAVGEALADMVTGVATAVDLSPFRLDRFERA